jgi:YVTN family beta-propeller protein
MKSRRRLRVAFVALTASLAACGDNKAAAPDASATGGSDAASTDAPPPPSFPRIVKTIPVGSGAAGQAVDASANRVYVAAIAASVVTVLDGSSDTVVASIPITAVGDSPSQSPYPNAAPGDLAIDDSAHRIYVANGNGTVSVIDGTTNTVIDNIQVGPGIPNSIRLNRTTKKLYVAIYEVSVVVIDTTTDKVVATIADSPDANGLAINETTNRIYVTNYNAGTLAVIDGSTDQIVKSIPVGTAYSSDGSVIGSGPDFPAVNSVTNKVYVPNVNDGTVAVVDGATNAVIETLHTPNGAFTAAVNSHTNATYWTNTADNTLWLLNGHDDVIVGALQVLPLPAPDYTTPFISGVTCNEVTGKTYVTTFGPFFLADGSLDLMPSSTILVME